MARTRLVPNFATTVSAIGSAYGKRYLSKSDGGTVKEELLFSKRVEVWASPSPRSIVKILVTATRVYVVGKNSIVVGPWIITQHEPGVKGSSQSKLVEARAAEKLLELLDQVVVDAKPWATSICEIQCFKRERLTCSRQKRAQGTYQRVSSGRRQEA